MGEALNELMNNCMYNGCDIGGVPIVGRIPINKIDNIPVSIHIWYTRNNYHYFFHCKVNALKYNWTLLNWSTWGVIDEDSTNDEGELTLQNQKKSFIRMLKTLKTMRMNYISGKFDDLDTINTNIHKEFRDFFMDNPSVKIGEDGCCVCHTSTKTYTNCKHCICWECLAKLIPVENTKPNCPLCHQKIKYIEDPSEFKLLKKDEDEDED